MLINGQMESPFRIIVIQHYLLCVLTNFKLKVQITKEASLLARVCCIHEGRSYDGHIGERTERNFQSVENSI